MDPFDEEIEKGNISRLREQESSITGQISRTIKDIMIKESDIVGLSAKRLELEKQLRNIRQEIRRRADNLKKEEQGKEQENVVRHETPE
jgi:hypothetical protein